MHVMQQQQPVATTIQQLTAVAQPPPPPAQQQPQPTVRQSSGGSHAVQSSPDSTCHDPVEQTDRPPSTPTVNTHSAGSENVLDLEYEVQPLAVQPHSNSRVVVTTPMGPTSSSGDLSVSGTSVQPDSSLVRDTDSSDNTTMKRQAEDQSGGSSGTTTGSAGSASKRLKSGESPVDGSGGDS